VVMLIQHQEHCMLLNLQQQQLILVAEQSVLAVLMQEKAWQL